MQFLQSFKIFNWIGIDTIKMSWVYCHDIVCPEHTFPNEFTGQTVAEKPRFRSESYSLKFSISMINYVIAIWQEGVLVQESWMAGRFLWAKFYVWLYQGVPIKHVNVYSEFHDFLYQGVPWYKTSFCTPRSICWIMTGCTSDMNNTVVFQHFSRPCNR